MLILKTLARGALHVTTSLRDRAGVDGVLLVEEGALYQALHGWNARPARFRMGRFGDNRRAKFYRLTAQGRAHLKADRSSLGAGVGGGLSHNADSLGALRWDGCMDSLTLARLLRRRQWSVTLRMSCSFTSR